MIDVGGRKLHCYVYGKGSPTVVLVSGFGAPQAYWNSVIPDLAAKTTVVTYDRAGIGKSEIGDRPTHGEQSAKDLRVLLEKLSVPNPYLLVGHSYGGSVVRLSASMYPDDMGGLILEDAQHEDILDEQRKILRGKDLEALEQMVARFGTPKNPKTEADYLNLTTEIEFPLTCNPGEKMRYNTFQTHLLSAIITKASNLSTLEFARKFLTDPMGITIDRWEQDPQGYYFGGNSMFFTPRELAVLGYLYLNDGRLNGRQIVPGHWAALSLSPTTSRSSAPWGVLTNYAYGYLWWPGQINNQAVFMALGHGGQTVLTFPALNLIVVTTANNLVDWDTADAQERAVLEIISGYILPAIVN